MVAISNQTNLRFLCFLLLIFQILEQEETEVTEKIILGKSVCMGANWTG
jgi:hypothetical protein